VPMVAGERGAAKAAE